MLDFEQLHIDDLFTSVVSNLRNYEPRPQQIAMAEGILNALYTRQNLIVEAGTGSGKSFGYLIPIVAAGEKAVISTGTIALQEQLLNKDLPFLVNNLNPELTYALAKGRSHYLCKQKFFDVLRNVPPKSQEGGILKRLENLILTDWFGDSGELDFTVPSVMWTEINSNKEDCIMHRCEYFNSCPFRINRAILADSDIIIANHSLYFADLATFGAILPAHDYVVFDEAHQVKSTATKTLTVNIGRWASTKLIQKIQKRLRYIPEYITAPIMANETEIISWLFGKDRDVFRLYPDNSFYTLVGEQMSALMRLRNWLNEMEMEQLNLIEEEKLKKMSHRDLLLSQATNLINRWEYFLDFDKFEKEEQRVNWVEINRDRGNFELHSAPIFIAEELSENLWKKRTAILTSATLSINGKFDYLKTNLGVDGTQMILESPFDYQKQSKLYLPKSYLDPNSPDYNAYAASVIKDLLFASEGRALVLFTSINAMKNVSANVMEHVDYPHRLQGDLPRQKLLEWFKETDNSILFATATFWEGIDIPGEDLSLVIIDKIPFFNPDDPIASATIEYMKAHNMSWFMEFMLPEAIIKLKQGFGRLIRTKEDKGVISILDPRLQTKGYGRTVINSLPKTSITTSFEEIDLFFASIKSASS